MLAENQDRQSSEDGQKETLGQKFYIYAHLILLPLNSILYIIVAALASKIMIITSMTILIISLLFHGI